MIWLPGPLGRQWRRWFGTVTIDDPRPIARDAPYTYFLPSENELLAIAPNDLVKLSIRSHPPSDRWDAERVWLQVTETEDDRLTGTLDNKPSDIPHLDLGAVLHFRRSDVIDIIWSEERPIEPPAAPPRHTYWDRCLVDRCVVDEGMPVHYLYREEPDLTREGDAYPDSGWRIRGDYREIGDAEIDAREQEYVALGKVLNVDDGWLALIDAPIGSAFIRDWESGGFVPCEDER